MQKESEILKIELATTHVDLGSLTALLHRAYAELGDMGLRFKAVDQSIDVTRQRIAAGECFLALIGSSLVGTALFIPSHRTKGTAWLNRPDVASLHQLAVEPTYQRSGVGRRLMEIVEARAVQCGAVASSIACSSTFTVGAGVLFGTATSSHKSISTGNP